MSKFSDFPDTMVITPKEILDGKKSVLSVSYDEEDGMWQFLDGSDELDIDNARIVTLGEMLIDWLESKRVDRDTKWLRQENV